MSDRSSWASSKIEIEARHRTEVSDMSNTHHREIAERNRREDQINRDHAAKLKQV